ncbi:MAG: hypothetical protein HYZ57_12875 [Acidobacteria bacterium]|nr:hypothetical protein [Acidobacteriota bacterium]MBI3280723.1 hypothetical protein [Acidobacteriota bacterium]
MGRFKAARGARKQSTGPVSAIPCLILLVTGFVLFALLFYFIVKSG